VPDVLLMLGMDTGQRCIQVERKARNIDAWVASTKVVCDGPGD
jgi:hypothetical protein